MLELGKLTSTIGEELCVDFQFLVPEGEDCFRSDGRLEEGIWWLGASAGLWMAANALAFCPARSCGAADAAEALESGWKSSPPGPGPLHWTQPAGGAGPRRWRRSRLFDD